MIIVIIAIYITVMWVIYGFSNYTNYQKYLATMNATILFVGITLFSGILGRMINVI